MTRDPSMNRGGGVSRRVFLALGLGAVGLGAAIAAGLAIVPGWRRGLLRNLPRVEGFTRSPRSRLLSHFDYLDIGDGVVERYLEAYSARYGPLGRFSFPRRDFYTRFLLSTNFFQNSADPTRPLHYVSFFHPYASPCYNPLARFS